MSQDLLTASTAQQKTVLHVGCGVFHPSKVHPTFKGWKEIRQDIDPNVQPDILCSMVNMNTVADASFDGIWSSHNLEHLFAHEVPLALAEFFRVLRPGGIVLVTMPDLQQVATLAAEGRLEEAVYMAPDGPVAALDMFYGHSPQIARGNHFMAHRTGFTEQTLGQKLQNAGFVSIQLQRGNFNLWGFGTKPA